MARNEARTGAEAPETDRVIKLRAKLEKTLRRELAKCAKCGACAAVCPVYAEMKHEAFCARGKLMLAKALVEGRLEPASVTQDIFNDCLICMACVKNCGSGVRFDQVITAARELLVAQKGQQPVKRVALRHVLHAPKRLAALMKGGGVLQKLAYGVIPETSGLKLRFPLPLLPADLPVPAISRRPFTSRVPEFNPAPQGASALSPGAAPGSAPPESAHNIVYFPGCAANYLYPTIGEALLYVLARCGFSVRVPKDLVCCGTPAAAAGEGDVVRRLAAHNLARLGATAGTVVTACGSGGLMLRHEYARFLEEDERAADDARTLAARCMDISEILMRRVGADRLAGLFTRRVAGRLTYHEACHLGRGLGISAEPRALLKLLGPGFVEMPDAGRCCGSGGTYGLTHWEESKEILKKKMDNAARVQAVIIATGCPSCMVQLTTGARIMRADQAIFHVVELAAWAMGYTPSDRTERARFDRLRPA